jgi:hypothetical protein
VWLSYAKFEASADYDNEQLDENGNRSEEDVEAFNTRQMDRLQKSRGIMLSVDYIFLVVFGCIDQIWIRLFYL